MTVEQILARLQAILDGSKGRNLTAAEVTEYENLEGDLAQARATEQVRARNAAYNSPAPGLNVPVAPPKIDNGLERAFENYLRTGRPNADIAGLRVSEGTYSNVGQADSPNTAGGFMVPPGFREKLVEVQKAFGGVAADADTFSTDNGASLTYPSLDDTANQGQITAEGAAVSGGADMVFGQIVLGAFRYTSSGASNLPLKVSVELLQDAAFDVAGLISRKLGERIARKQAQDWVSGAGTTLPFGVARVGLTADATLAAGNVFTYPQIVDVETALDPAYEQDAKWYLNKTSWQNLRKVVDTTGRPLINGQDMGIGVDGRPARNLLGYPVVIDQGFTPNTTLSGVWAVLGNMREAYVIRRVTDVVVIVNPYSSAASGQVEFTAWQRADGNVQNRKAYAVAKSNAA